MSVLDFICSVYDGVFMRSRGWLILGMLAFPTLAAAQTVTKADVVGGWRAEFEHDSLGKAMGLGTNGWLVLWPDGLWAYGGSLMNHYHGGARWRLVGDTLWLGNDYTPYFHPMIGPRMRMIQVKGYGLAVMDTDVISKRPPWLVPDSVYWSKAFRDTTTACDGTANPQCGTWVYKVSKSDQGLYLVRLDELSRNTRGGRRDQGCAETGFPNALQLEQLRWDP